MPIATLTSKGRITLPQSVRRSLGLRAGDKLEFVADEAGGFKIAASRNPVQTLRGRFAGRGLRAVSLRDMDRAVLTEAGRTK